MNRIKAKIVVLVFSITSLLFSQNGNSQNQGVPTNNLLYAKKPSISSPNAAAIEKHIEFPAANFTGVADISIPVHQITLRGTSVPVSLFYHASGIKVDEVSSDVGIGWSLVAGGSINIMANGMLDELSGFPLTDVGNYQKIKDMSFVGSYPGGLISCFAAEECSQGVFGCDPFDLYSGQDIYFLRNVVRNNADAEPDLYAFSFLGRSGKFFQDENGIFRTIPYSELKIERLLINNKPGGYKITDENGIAYEFKLKEESEEVYINNSVNPNSVEHLTTKVATSYQLTKVITPTSESVDFYYTSYPLSYQLQKMYSRATFGSGSGSTTCWSLNGAGNLYYSTTVDASRGGGASRLDSIRASDGTLLKFLYSANSRTDLPGAKALEKIETWSYLGGRKMLNQNLLNYDYSTGRLTLKSIQESTKPATQFIYNGTALPARLSNSQDSYGFYNGFPNWNTLLPVDEFNEFWDGANRSVVPNYTQAGILTKIIHPTGGSTEYTYEPNEIYVSTNTTTYPKVIGAYLTSLPNQTVTSTFTISNSCKRIRLNYLNSWDGSTINTDYCIIHLTGPNNFIQNFVGNSSLNIPPLNLAPGQYTLSIENVGTTYSAEATLFWFQETILAPHNESAGGVRIKEIKKYDKDGSIALRKFYEYKITGTNNSSGVNENPPTFIEYKGQKINLVTTNNNTCYQLYCTFTAQNSNSIVPLTYANGGYVMYKEVTTYLRDKTQNGFSNYKYNVSTNGLNVGMSSFPYAPNIPYDWVNGSLLEQNDYAYKNNQFKLVKKTKNFYNYDQFDPVMNSPYLYKGYGAKIAIMDAPYICLADCNTSTLGANFFPISFGMQGYKYYSSWHRLDRTDEIIYDENGNNPLTNTINYSYENPNRIAQTKIETLNSKGDLIKTEFKYPYDFPNDAVYNSMVAKNMIAPVIQKSNFKNTTSFLQSTKANYNFWNNGWGVNNSNSLIVPQTVEATILNNPTEIRQQINRYDAHGNILEIQKPNDLKEVYIYGYNSNYPVAKVIGSDYATVSGFVSQTILDNVDGSYSDAQIKTQLNNIRAGLSGTKALVTTYTYFPFVGMASETDPNGQSTFYEYDNLNRLALVRDNDNNILKKICYNYQGQPEDCTTSNCANTSPIWQNTTTALRCQKDWTGQNTGNQEQEQMDVNTCSASYNQLQWVSVGQNTTACPLPVSINLTSTNVTGASGYTASYLNTATNFTYTFAVPATTGLQSLGAIPAGNYTLTISRTIGTPIYGTFKSGCFKQVITGSSATFFNVAVSATTCNSITVDISGIQ